MKLSIIYLIGLVAFTCIFYLMGKQKNLRGTEILCVVFGAAWPVYVPYLFVMYFVEKRRDA